jgi:RHS repeat-associated protein
VDGEPRTYTYFKNGSNPLNGQRLASDGELAYTYDANGNTLTRTGVMFGWDADDRMTSISGAVTASYTYDHQGRRTGKTVGGATTSYLYDGLNLVRTSGASAADYLFGPGIDEPLAMLRGGNVHYVAVDGLGSVTLLSDPAGTLENTYLYDAWGELREQTGTLANDFGYTGREFGEAGLWYYRARYYQPGIGRFNREDDVRLLDGPSAYRYSKSSPVGLVDPLGLCTHCDECPSGKWRYAGVAATFVRSLGALPMDGSLFYGRFRCIDSSAVVWVTGYCEISGPILGAGAGWEHDAGFYAEGCNGSDLIGSSSGWTMSAGPLSFSGGRGSSGGSTGVNLAYSKSWGGGFGSTKCETFRANPSWRGVFDE